MERVCKKCNKKLPNSINVNGKKHNIQNRKFCTKCSPFKQGNTRDLSLPTRNKNTVGQTKWCNKCKQYVDFGKFSPRKNENRLSAYCLPCMAFIKAAGRIKLKKLCVDYKGGHCCRCGYDKCFDALEFHHLDSDTKDFNISEKRTQFLTEEIKLELDKCILLCSNCHREEHSKYSGLLAELVNASG